MAAARHQRTRRAEHLLSVAIGELQTLLDGAGVQAQVETMAWSSRVHLEHRIASRYRAGPLFLVGDAAHVNSPAGGQGMNTGIQDAVNLGWKLAFAAANLPDRATSDLLLDSYQRERRPVAQHVMALTHALFWAEAATNPIARFARGPLAAVRGACRAVRARAPSPRRRGCAPTCPNSGSTIATASSPRRACRRDEASRALVTGWRTRPSPSPVLADGSTNSSLTPACTCCSTATHARSTNTGSGRTCGYTGSRTERVQV